MKNLKEIIQEKLKIGSKTQVKTYKYIPKSLDELKGIIKDIIKEEGPDANLNIIDVSDITNMNGLFNIMEYGKPIEIGNIKVDDWNVSNVRIMRNMFLKCAKFNCDISNWDVSKVSDMSGMFYGCKEFNQDISKWNVSKVVSMERIFSACHEFNQNLDSWNVKEDCYTESAFIFCKSLTKKPKWYKDEEY